MHISNSNLGQVIEYPDFIVDIFPVSQITFRGYCFDTALVLTIHDRLTTIFSCMTSVSETALLNILRIRK